MQRNKTIIFLGLVLLVLLSVMVMRSKVPLISSDKDNYMGMIENLNANDLFELRLAQAGEEIKINIVEDKWNVNEYEADQNQVDEFIQGLLIPSQVEVISETSTKHDVFEVNEDLGVKVELKTDGEEKTFWLGGASTGGRYVRFEGEDRVFLVDDLPSNSSLVNIDTWIDTTLTRIPPDKMKSITTVRDGEQIGLEQKDGEWYEQGEDTALDKTGFTSMLQTLTTMVTQGLDDALEADESPYMMVKVERVEAEPVELMFFEGEEDMVKVTSSGKKGVFKISATTADNFELTEVDLKPIDVDSAEGVISE